MARQHAEQLQRVEHIAETVWRKDRYAGGAVLCAVQSKQKIRPTWEVNLAIIFLSTVDEVRPGDAASEAETMAAMDPGDVVLQAEQVLRIRGVDAGVEIIGACDRNRRFVVVLGGTIDPDSRESKGRMGRGQRTDSVVGNSNLIEQVRPEYVICLLYTSRCV